MKSKIPQQIFKNKSVATPQHDEMLLIFKNKNPIYVKLIKKLLIRYILDCNVILPTNIIDLIILKQQRWLPEYPIFCDKYYNGSIDLYVDIRIDVSKIKNIINKNSNLSYSSNKFSIIFEFKPNIISFSETIRQIKVYERYMKEKVSKLYLVVATYSDISKFKDIFVSQGIELIQLKKDGTNDSQTNLG